MSSGAEEGGVNLAIAEKAIEDIIQERGRQDAKWGRQDHEPSVWLMILGEEVGEATKAALEAKFGEGGERDWQHSMREYRSEMVQVAAVAMAMIESVDKNELAACNE